MSDYFSPPRVRLNNDDVMEPPALDQGAEMLVGIAAVALAVWAWCTLIDPKKVTPEETWEKLE